MTKLRLQNALYTYLPMLQLQADLTDDVTN